MPLFNTLHAYLILSSLFYFYLVSLTNKRMHQTVADPGGEMRGMHPLHRHIADFFVVVKYRQSLAYKNSVSELHYFYLLPVKGLRMWLALALQ